MDPLWLTLTLALAVPRPHATAIDPTRSLACVTLPARRLQRHGWHGFACLTTDRTNPATGVALLGAIQRSDGTVVCTFSGQSDVARCLTLQGCAGHGNHAGDTLCLP